MNKQFFYILFIAFLSCAEQNANDKSPRGYDLNKPQKFTVPDALKEISGISFYKGNSDVLYAEQDEDGKLYYLHLGDKNATHVKFGKKGDYEDLAIINEQVIFLRSDGTLFSFPFKEINNEEVTDVREWNDLLPTGEFEGLCADAKNNQLYVLCKHCNDDETSKTVTAYILQLLPGGGITKKTSVSINVKTIEKLSGDKKIKFHPSALAQNPQTQQWFIVSAVNQMLVIADKDWTVKEVYHLKASIFRQPEGIAFDNNNNLYISNEGDKVSKGNVLKFVFKKE